jgi:hypothetical protein
VAGVYIVRRLQLALSKSEKVERMIAVLDEMKGQGATEAEQYESLIQDYINLRLQAADELAAVRQEIESERAVQKRNLDFSIVESRELDMRSRDGSISAADFGRARERLVAKESRLRTAIAELERLHSARSSIHVGGYIDVQLDNSRGTAMRGESVAPPSALGTGDFSKYLQFVHSSSELGTPRLRALVPFAGLLMFISLFLRWQGVSSYYGSMAVSGTSNGGTTAIGILTVVFCIAAWSLVHPRVRGGVQTLMGSIAVLVVLLTWIPGEEARYIGVVLREGFYMFLAAAACLIVCGIAALREP